jgi:hypothetical protein
MSRPQPAAAGDGPVTVGNGGVLRLARQRWVLAVVASARVGYLSWHRVGQAVALAELLRVDGTLERPIDEIAEHLVCHRRTVDRLVRALVDAGLLVRAARSSPAGPPIYLARHPLALAVEVDEPTIVVAHAPEKGAFARPGVPRRGVAHVRLSDLRAYAAARARSTTSATGGDTTPRSAGEDSTDGPDAACCAHCSRRAVVAAATYAASVTPGQPAQPVTRTPRRRRRRRGRPR